MFKVKKTELKFFSRWNCLLTKWWLRFPDHWADRRGTVSLVKSKTFKSFECLSSLVLPFFSLFFSFVSLFLFSLCEFWRIFYLITNYSLLSCLAFILVVYISACLICLLFFCKSSLVTWPIATTSKGLIRHMHYRWTCFLKQVKAIGTSYK